MRTLPLLLFTVLLAWSGRACTSAVVSGKATADGRPLLWKHRDSEFDRNKLRYFQGPSYSFVGVVNSDTLQDEVWMGSNSAGFSIMNTAAYNLNIGVQCPADEEGIFMAAVLGRCGTLAEFERYLDSTNGKRGVDANFGVIDASGGAAYYEVGFLRWKKFDANDPAVAPDGYLLRTNFAASGNPGYRKGTVRYATIQRLVGREYARRKLSVEFLLHTADRSLEHSLTNVDLASGRLPADSTARELVLFRDFIVRNSTVSTMLVHGVRKGEDPRLTTLWGVLGWPLTTVALPVWVAGGRVLPRLALSSDGATSPVNEWGLALKKRAFPAGVDNSYDYLDRAVIVNRRGNGFWQLLRPVEQKIVSQTARLVARWRKGGFDRAEARSHYDAVDNQITAAYGALFRLGPATEGKGAESVQLEHGWRFRVGDSLAFAQSNWEDDEWKAIGVDRIWEQQGYDPLDGFAWYRIRFHLPRSFLHAPMHDSVRFSLGKINNFDQAFLNGKLIGVNGSTVQAGTPPDSQFLKAETGLWDVERNYVLASDDPRLRWGETNVIAVRVFDQGGQGGLWQGRHEVRPARLSDYLTMERGTVFELSGGSARKNVVIRNSSSRYTLNGMVRVIGKGKVTGKTHLEKWDRLGLDPGAELQVGVEVPAGDEAVRLTYACVLRGAADTLSFTEESPYILTPPESDLPRINGASVTGCRPGRPFLFAVAASGAAPLTYVAAGLPAGLRCDPATGIISGTAPPRGTYNISLRVANRQGECVRNLAIVSGDLLALTPPMGWNSWNVWGLTVDQRKVLASARVFREKGLMRHGWSYINIDDGWEIKGDHPAPKRHSDGRIIVNEKFPDLKGLGDSLHAHGMKLGIYSSPGPLTCGGYTASYRFEGHDARSYGEWGIDYLKYDWCSYGGIARDTSREELMKPYRVMRAALDSVPRDIVYSLCQYGMGNVWEWGAAVGGNLWRTTGDITDTWESMSSIGFSQVQNRFYAGPGKWNDPDMLVVGWVGWGPSLHPTRLTPDEQYTHISLWAILSAPLLIGCDLERLDPFTLNLLTNDEILAVNQDPLGKQGGPVVVTDSLQIWVKELEGGKQAVGIFNLGTETRSLRLDAKQCGIRPEGIARDLWRQHTLGRVRDLHTLGIPGHGVIMLGVE